MQKAQAERRSAVARLSNWMWQTGSQQDLKSVFRSPTTAAFEFPQLHGGLFRVLCHWHILEAIAHALPQESGAFYNHPHGLY
jgi:hypothetical protein